jgi:hypothetical protein
MESPSRDVRGNRDDTAILSPRRYESFEAWKNVYVHAQCTHSRHVFALSFSLSLSEMVHGE